MPQRLASYHHLFINPIVCANRIATTAACPFCHTMKSDHLLLPCPHRRAIWGKGLQFENILQLKVEYLQLSWDLVSLRRIPMVRHRCALVAVAALHVAVLAVAATADWLIAVRPPWLPSRPLFWVSCACESSETLLGIASFWWCRSVSVYMLLSTLPRLRTAIDNTCLPSSLPPLPFAGGGRHEHTRIAGSMLLAAGGTRAAHGCLERSERGWGYTRRMECKVQRNRSRSCWRCDRFGPLCGRKEPIVGRCDFTSLSVSARPPTVNACARDGALAVCSAS